MASLCHLPMPHEHTSIFWKANSAFASDLLLDYFSHRAELIKQLLTGQLGTSLRHIDCELYPARNKEHLECQTRKLAHDGQYQKVRVARSHQR